MIPCEGLKDGKYEGAWEGNISFVIDQGRSNKVSALLGPHIAEADSEDDWRLTQHDRKMRNQRV